MLAIIVLHTITGACTPVCLLAASIPVEAVTPPSELHVRRLSCTAGLNWCQLPQPNSGCANFMATVFKDLSSILVDGRKKSTPRRLVGRTPNKSGPGWSLLRLTYLMLRETPEALQFGLRAEPDPHHLQWVCHRAVTDPLAVIPGLRKIETRTSLSHQYSVTPFNNISVRGRKL